MRTTLNLKPASAAALMFDVALPYVFGPGADIHDIKVTWNRAYHPSLRSYTVTATVQGHGASQPTEVVADVAIRPTDHGWTDGLFDWMGLKDDLRLHGRYIIDLSGDEPTFRAA